MRIETTIKTKKNIKNVFVHIKKENKTIVYLNIRKILISSYANIVMLHNRDKIVFSEHLKQKNQLKRYKNKIVIEI